MKKIYVYLLVTIALSACHKNPPAAISENERIIREYFSHFNKHDWEKMAGMYADKAEFKDPSLGQGIVQQSQKQIIEKYSGLNEMFPNIKDEIVKVYPSGEKHIVVEFLSTGKSKEGFTFKLPICTIFTIENGKITQDFTYYDNMEDTP